MSLFKFSMGYMPVVYASGSADEAAKYQDWLDDILPGYVQEAVEEVPLAEPLLYLDGIVDVLTLKQWEQIESTLPGLLILGHDYSLIISDYTLGYYTTKTPALPLVATLPEDSIARRLIYTLEPSCVSSLFVKYNKLIQELEDVTFEQFADILLADSPSAAIAKLSNRHDTM
jgi:hypothetical protein